MLTIGLTGNIASGKSTVSARLAEHGAVVLDSDAFARATLAPGTPGFERVLARFGDALRMSDGSLDRAALGRIVFADSAARRDLEAIVHPEVARLRKNGLAEAAAAGTAVAVCDVPLLFESGLHDQFDIVVLVHAPEDARLDRLIRQRGVAVDDARAMMAAQGDPDLKRAMADHVLVNDGSRDELIHKVDSLWSDLAPRAALG
ncbi:MAG: dephospho-CoA kinase [Gemmatimonadetes bacterium]|nr:dephospho-CoA kinase [Gemmatimonadota bacterium]